VERSSQQLDVVAHDAAPLWNTAKLAHRVGQDLGVGIVDVRRRHTLARRDELVAGRNNGDPRLPPHGYLGLTDGSEHARFAAG
jgi:hypothetical protein